MLLDIVLFLVLEQSLEDVVALEVLAHQIINYRYVVAQQELREVVLAAEDLLLKVLQQQCVILTAVKMKNYQPLLELSTQVTELHSVVVLHDFES